MRTLRDAVQRRVSGKDTKTRMLLGSNKRGRFAPAATLAATTIALLLGAGCGDNKTASGGGGTSPAPESTSAGSASPAPSGTPMKVAVIPKGLTHVFWQSVKAGAEKAGSEKNVEIKWDGPQKETDTSQQVGIVENAINNKVDGIVLAPLDKAALVNVIKKAKEKKIPLTIFDSAADVTEDDYVSFVATDNKKGGELAAERLGKLLNGKGTVALIPVQPNSASTMDRESGFEETIKAKFPGMKVIRSSYSMNDRANALKVVEDVLTAHSEIVGVFSANEPAAVGALQALKNRQLVGKIKLVGFDSTKQLEDALEKGDLDSLVVQNPYKMGYEGVMSLVDLKAGKTPEKRIDTGVVLMTKDNLETPEVKALRAK
jgi:ribose transport system substrate-binding protein